MAEDVNIAIVGSMITSGSWKPTCSPTMSIGVCSWDLLEMIEAGVTSVADHYWHMDYGRASGRESGHARPAGASDVRRGNGMGQVEETAAFAQALAWRRPMGAFCTIMAPHSPYTCDDDFLRASARKAERHRQRHPHPRRPRRCAETKASLAETTWNDAHRGTGLECGIFSCPHHHRARAERRHARRPGDLWRTWKRHGRHCALPQDLRQAGYGLQQSGGSCAALGIAVGLGSGWRRQQ